MGHGGYFGRIFNEGNTRDVSSLGERFPSCVAFFLPSKRWWKWTTMGWRNYFLNLVVSWIDRITDTWRDTCLLQWGGGGGGKFWYLFK